MLTGALPLLVSRGEGLKKTSRKSGPAASSPLGRQVIHTVRSYLTLLGRGPDMGNPRDAIDALKDDVDGDHPWAVLHALEDVVVHSSEYAGELQYA